MVESSPRRQRRHAEEIKMRVRWLVTTVVCGTVLLAPAYGGWALLGQSPPTALGVLPARPESATLSDDDRTSAPFRVAARGRIEPVSEELDLAIGLVGTLAAVYVDEGDTV